MHSKTLTLALLAAFCLLLVLQVGLSVLEETVRAQPGGVDPFLIVVNGTWIDNEEPIYAINTHEESICVYEYNSEANRLKLVAVRSYKWDRKIQEYNNLPPSVRLVQSRVGTP